MSSHQDYKDFLENSSNLMVLHYLKRDGLPQSDEELTMLFQKFNQREKGQYPIHWEDLLEYMPEIENQFGQQRYLDLNYNYNLQGNMEYSILLSNMSYLDKNFMWFVYEIPLNHKNPNLRKLMSMESIKDDKGNLLPECEKMLEECQLYDFNFQLANYEAQKEKPTYDEEGNELNMFA